MDAGKDQRARDRAPGGEALNRLKEVTNMTVAYIIVAALVAVAIYFGVRYFVRAARRFGGSRVIVCPETGRQAMVSR